jgi:hypothetical protein
LAEAIGRFVESNKNKSDKTVNEEPPENVKTYTLYVTLDNSKIVTKKFSSAIEAIREVFYKSQKLKSFVLELDGRNTLIESNYRFMCESFGCNASVDGRIMLYGDESFRRFLEVQDLYEDFDTELYNIAVDY